jgi:hypothetical protein
VTTHERLEGLGKLARVRHARPVNQDGDDTDVARERRRDFDRYEIAGIVEPASALIVPGIQPIGTDHREENVAGGQLPVQIVHEVDPGGNVVDIHDKRKQSYMKSSQ